MRRLVLLASAIVLVDMTFYSVVAPLLPYYTDELGLSDSAAGVLAAAYPAGTLLGSLPAGMLAARIGPRRTVLAALVLLSASSLVFGFAENIVLLDAARFVQGIAGACTWAGALTWLIGAAPVERRGELIGTALGAAVGGALLGPVVGAIAGMVGPRIVFGSVVVISLGLAAWALTTPPPPRATENQPLSQVLRALGDRRVGLGVWLVALPAITYGVMSVIGALRLDDLGASDTAVGVTFLVAAGIEAAMSPFIGRFSDRRGRLLPIRIGLVASALTLVLFTAPQTVLPLAVAMILVTVALALFWGPAMALLSHATEVAGLHLAIGFAFVNLAWSAGQTLGSAGGGALAETSGDAVAPLLVAAILLVTFAVLARSVLVRRAAASA